jgi:hypothetical protein
MTTLDKLMDMLLNKSRENEIKLKNLKKRIMSVIEKSEKALTIEEIADMILESYGYKTIPYKSKKIILRDVRELTKSGKIDVYNIYASEQNHNILLIVERLYYIDEKQLLNRLSEYEH